MTSPILKLTLATALAATLAGCAHDRTTDRKIDQEVQAQPSAPMGGPMAAESRKMITDSPNLSTEQKDKLLALHARMAGEVARIREEEGKLKMVFFRTILDPKSSEAEIANIKKRVLDLDRKKTNRMLSALEEARGILGRQEQSDRERLFRAFSFESPAGRPMDTF